MKTQIKLDENRTCGECRWLKSRKSPKRSACSKLKPPKGKKDPICEHFEELFNVMNYRTRDSTIKRAIVKLDNNDYMVPFTFRSELADFDPWGKAKVSYVNDHKDLEKVMNVLVFAQGYRDRTLTILDDIQQVYDRVDILYSDTLAYVYMLSEIKSLSPKDVKDKVANAILEPMVKRMKYLDTLKKYARETLTKLTLTGDTVDKLVMVYRSTRKTVSNGPY